MWLMARILLVLVLLAWASPTTGTITIQSGVLVAIPLAEADGQGQPPNVYNTGRGFPTRGKHMTLAVDPATGYVWFTGEYGAVPYSQETWWADINEWMTQGKLVAHLAYPFVGFGGSSVQPKWPDIFGLQFRAADGRGYHLPGTPANNFNHVLPAGETINGSFDGGSDPNFLWAHVMSFNPAPAAQNTPNFWRDEGHWQVISGGSREDWQNTWQSIIDDVTDAAYGFGANNADGSFVRKFDLKTHASTRPLRGFDRLNLRATPLAFDKAKGAIYAIEPNNFRLYRYNIDARGGRKANTLDDLGVAPADIPRSNGDGSTIGPFMFDTKHRIALYANGVYGGAGLTTMWAYHVDTAVWETIPVVTNPPNTLFQVRAGVYHAALDCFIMGTFENPPGTHYFLYRYAPRTSTRGQ
jgi:hypothetical protein